MSTQLKGRIQREADSYSQDYYLDRLDKPFGIYEFNVMSSALRDFATRYLEPGDRILDMGCGTGVYARVLRETGHYEVFLADLSFNMLLQAQKKPLSNLMQADGEQTPFPDHFFDAIISIAMLEHVVDPGLILEELLRIAKPGGYLFLAAPNSDYYSLVVLAKLRRIRRAWGRGERSMTKPGRTFYERLPSRDEMMRLLQRDGVGFLRYRSVYFIDHIVGSRLARLSPKLLGVYLQVSRLMEVVLSRCSSRGYLHVVIARKAQER